MLDSLSGCILCLGWAGNEDNDGDEIKCITLNITLQLA